LKPRLTSLSAVWEKAKDGTRKAFFAHFATKSLQNAVKGPKVLNKAFTEFRTATNLGNDLPEHVWLYMADKDAKEVRQLCLPIYSRIHLEAELVGSQNVILSGRIV
jgi:hypothetical protein